MWRAKPAPDPKLISPSHYAKIVAWKDIVKAWRIKQPLAAYVHDGLTDADYGDLLAITKWGELLILDGKTCPAPKE